MRSESKFIFFNIISSDFLLWGAYQNCKKSRNLSIDFIPNLFVYTSLPSDDLDNDAIVEDQTSQREEKYKERKRKMINSVDSV